jgi:hypothetical protein
MGQTGGKIREITPKPIPVHANATLGDSNIFGKMEFPVSEWFHFPAEEFPTANPRANSELCAEIMAQARPNGRVMDHWRIALGGSAILETSVRVDRLFPAALNLPNKKVQLQYWARDIAIRRNMTTSVWIDVVDLIRSNEASMVDETEAATSSEDVLTTLSAVADKSAASASLRWAVCIADDGQLELQLQHLPASAASLASRRYSRGIKIYTTCHDNLSNLSYISILSTTDT